MRIFTHPRLIPADKFPAEAKKAIERATTRIALVTTTLHADDERSNDLVQALCDAARRGVGVSVCADTYTYTEPKEFILWRPNRQPVRAIRALKIERRLKKAGASYRWLGRTSNIGFAGRTHSKWLIVDDTVYSFGGVNIDSQSFDNVDYMLRIRDSSTADALYSEHMRLLNADRANHATTCTTIHIREGLSVLIDGGLVGDSIIYRRACALARQATDITLVSQYCPTGKISRILKRKQADQYFNHWREAAWLNKFMISFGMLSSRQSTHYNRRDYLHAKFIIFTMEDGSKVALSGSHNFMFSSVLIGTREIALETTDPHVIKSLEKFLDQRIK